MSRGGTATATKQNATVKKQHTFSLVVLGVLYRILLALFKVVILVRSMIRNITYDVAIVVFRNVRFFVDHIVDSGVVGVVRW